DGCRSVRILADDSLIDDPAQLAYRLRPVRQLDIEAHDPLVRFKFGTFHWIGPEGAAAWVVELAIDGSDPRSRPLFDRIGQVVSAAYRKHPVRDWLDRDAPWVRQPRRFWSLLAFGAAIASLLTMATLLNMPPGAVERRNAIGFLLFLWVVGPLLAALVYLG